MAIGWGGFAQGLTAGSNAAAAAYKAQRDAEEQDFLREERQRVRDFREDIKKESAPGEVTEKSGLMVTPKGEGWEAKPFYVPADSGAIEAYKTAGYDVSEAPAKYAELRAGGRLVAPQMNVSDFVGPEPTRGVAETYDKGRMQRLQETALRHDIPERAVAYSTLTSNALQQELTKGEIGMLPGKRTKQQQEIEANQLALDTARDERDMLDASRTMQGAIEHYNKKIPNGYNASVQPTSNGMQQMTVTGPNGEVEKVGKPFKTWDEDGGGRDQYMSRIPALAKEAFKIRLQTEGKIKEVEATGKWHLDYARILAAARGTSGPSKQELAAFQKEHDEINAKFKAGEYTYEEAIERVNIAGAKIGRPITPPKASRLDSMSWTEQQALRDAATAAISTTEKFKNIPKGEAGDAVRETLIKEKMRELLDGVGTVRGGGRLGTTTGAGPLTYPTQWGGGAGGGAKTTPPGSPIVNPPLFGDQGVDWSRSTPSASPATNDPPEAVALDAARANSRAASAELQAFGTAQRAEDQMKNQGRGYAAAKARVAAARQAERDAEAAWARVAPSSRGAGYRDVTGRGMF